MNKKIFCGFLVALMMGSALAGCSQVGPSKTDGGASSAVSSQADADNEPGAATESGEYAFNVSGDYKVKKLGSFKVDGRVVECGTYGAAYEKDNKYGVISFDGSKDTGLVYDYADEIDGEHLYLTVYKADGDSVNVCGMVDKNSEEIIEPKYGFLSCLSERYIQVMTGEKETDNKDDALFYSTSALVSLVPKDGDTMYAGKWEIFDAKKKRFVPGVSGTKATIFEAAGQFLTYRDDSGTSHKVDADGKEITDGRTIYTDGSYKLESGKKAEIYDENGTKLFEYNTEDYKITGYNDSGFYEASSNMGDSKEIFVVDKKGKIVSQKIKGSYADKIAASLISVDKKTYTFDGKVVADVDGYMRNNTAFTDIYCVQGDKQYVVLKDNGDEIYNEAKDDSLTYSNLSISKDGDSGEVYYCFKDKDFTISGIQKLEGLIKTENNELKEVVSGGTLLSGYEDYTIPYGSNNNILIFAEKANEEGYDVYQFSTKAE